MPTTANILADSITESGSRLTTFQVRGPRFILAQLSKHRQFSISCRSSRAVPIRKMIAEVESDPVIPRFGKNQPGMVAQASVGDQIAEAAKEHWLDARDDAVDRARELAELGVAKETVNRLLEPFGWFDAVISATDYLNFFSLRIHDHAQHEIRELAVLMARAYRDSTPVLRCHDPSNIVQAWHLPYVTDDERAAIPLDDLKSISAARCGRVSYVPHDSDKPEVAKDLARAEKMAAESHAVPFEHVACAAGMRHYQSGNFRGWEQYRQRIAGNVAKSFDWSLVD